MTDTVKDILQFLKKPECGFKENISINKKLFLVFHSLIISVIICVSLASLHFILEYFNLIDMSKHATIDLFEKYSKIIILLLVSIIAPVFEELIFRAPITLFCNYRKHFKLIFYGFAILFGYVHITNFEFTTNIILLSPILVLPQIMLGLILGFLRVKIGLIYAILLHALYNGMLTLPVLLFGEL